MKWLPICALLLGVAACDLYFTHSEPHTVGPGPLPDAANAGFDAAPDAANPHHDAGTDCGYPHYPDAYPWPDAGQWPWPDAANVYDGGPYLTDAPH